jgi:membrane-associated phospholipid phosphatase
VTPAPPRDRRPALVAGACAGIAVLTGGLARTHDVAGAERSIGRWVYDLPGWTTPAWKAVMQTGVLWLGVAVAVVLLVARRRHAGTVLLTSTVLTWTLSESLKRAVGRGRPTLELLGRVPRAHETTNGWPSSHAAVSAALVTALLLALPLRAWQRAVLVALAAATAVARVHLAVHWALDVVGGAAIGIAVASIVHLAARRWA